jgi:hypothetical protein
LGWTASLTSVSKAIQNQPISVCPRAANAVGDLFALFIAGQDLLERLGVAEVGVVDINRHSDSLHFQRGAAARALMISHEISLLK